MCGEEFDQFFWANMVYADICTSPTRTGIHFQKCIHQAVVIIFLGLSIECRRSKSKLSTKYHCVVVAHFVGYLSSGIVANGLK